MTVSPVHGHSSSGEGQFLALPRLRSTQPPNAHSERDRHFAKTVVKRWLNGVSAVIATSADVRRNGNDSRNGHVGRIPPRSNGGSGTIGRTAGKGVCFAIDLVSSCSDSQMAAVTAARSSGEAKGWHSNIESERDLARRYVIDPAGQRRPNAPDD